MVTEPYEMGVGSNPIPMNSVFDRFNESPAASNHFIRSSKVIRTFFSHSAGVFPATTSIPSSAKFTANEYRHQNSEVKEDTLNKSGLKRLPWPAPMSGFHGEDTSSSILTDKEQSVRKLSVQSSILLPTPSLAKDPVIRYLVKHY